jgi:hypothetical protein
MGKHFRQLLPEDKERIGLLLKARAIDQPRAMAFMREAFATPDMVRVLREEGVEFVSELIDTRGKMRDEPELFGVVSRISAALCANPISPGVLDISILADTEKVKHVRETYLDGVRRLRSLLQDAEDMRSELIVRRKLGRFRQDTIDYINGFLKELAEVIPADQTVRRTTNDPQIIGAMQLDNLIRNAITAEGQHYQAIFAFPEYEGANWQGRGAIKDQGGHAGRVAKRRSSDEPQIGG